MCAASRTLHRVNLSLFMSTRVRLPSNRVRSARDRLATKSWVRSIWVNIRVGGQGPPGYSLTDAGEGGDEDGGLHVAGVNGEDAHEAADDADAHEQHVHVSPSQREDGQNRGTCKHTIDTTHTTSKHNTYPLTC